MSNTGCRRRSDVLDGGERVGVVARPQTTRATGHRPGEREDLLVHAERAERSSDPRTDDVRRAQRFEGSWLPVGRGRRSPAAPTATAGRVSGNTGGVPGGRYTRAAHGIRPARVLDEVSACHSVRWQYRDNKPAVGESRMPIVDGSNVAVGICELLCSRCRSSRPTCRR